LGISWSQLLERHDEHVIYNGQLQVNVTHCRDWAIYILPDAVIDVTGHAFVEITALQTHDDFEHAEVIHPKRLSAP